MTTSTHIAALGTIITARAVSWYDTDAKSDAPLPRAIIIAPNITLEALAVDGVERDIDTRVQIKFAAATVAALRRLVDDLDGDLHRSHPEVDGWSTSLHRIAASPIGVDRDATLPDTDGHTAAATLTYRYRATPA